jgi:hypothetical protein
MRFHANTPGATHARLSAEATPIYPAMQEDEEDSEARSQKSIILPVMSLEPEPVNRWAKVTTGVRDASFAGLRIFLNELTPQSESPAQSNPLMPEQRVQQFCATASITAQKLAELMAAVPVSLPVAHLIQQTLLPQSRQVHLAEVFMSGLLDVIPATTTQSRQLTQYRFPEPVREKLIDAVPISKTTQVLDTVSAYISERLGLGTKSFTALIAEDPRLELQQQQTIQPFAEIACSTLHRLGGDYRTIAQRLDKQITEVELKKLCQVFCQVYQVENQWGGSSASWHSGGDWMFGGYLHRENIAAIDIKSDDGGQTLSGTVTYSSGKGIDLRATLVSSNNYIVENQQRGNAELWVIGGRKNQNVVALDVKSDDGGQTLHGTMIYEGEGLIGFKGTRSSPSEVQDLEIVFFRVTGETCPIFSTLVTYKEAVENQALLSKKLDTWDIAKLADGGSMDGPGYNSKIREKDDRSFGHALCKRLDLTI